MFKKRAGGKLPFPVIFTLTPEPAPYYFVFDYLPSHIVVKARFGMHYIYLNKKIVLMLRRTGKGDGLNGIFVATVKSIIKP